jgi:subtilisin family serine protease
MKRTALAAFALLLSTTVFAAEAQRYLVATKRPMRGGALTAVKDAADVQPRDVVAFESFSGFAATLSEADVAKLQRSSEVRWVEPVVERNALAVRNLNGQTMPYGITALKAPDAWRGHRLATINVVVVDTGVDYTHSELKAIYRGGLNVFDGTAEVMDDNGHGTHVAGTIAAADNGTGVVGVAPHINLFSVKMLDKNGSGSSEGIIQSLDWVAQQKQARGGNWVVNLSLGADKESPGEREAFQKLADAGVLIVAAAGNASTPTLPAPVSFPAAYPTVTAVGAIDDKSQLAYFSSQGPEVDFAAPGVGVLSTIPIGNARIAYVIAGSNAYSASPVTGSKLGVVNAEFVYCGVGAPEDFPASLNLTGKIALIKRGADITFANKTRRALAAGATAVAIFNHDTSVTPWTLFSDDQAATTDWPVVIRLSKTDGDALAARGTGTMTLAYRLDDLGEKSGTSMACPHIAGAAALLWSLAPGSTPQQIVTALTVTATDLGAAGPDSKFGVGSIDVLAAAKALAPSAFTGPTTGRPIGKRGRG